MGLFNGIPESDGVNELNLSGSTIYFENLELARKTTNNEERGGYCLVDLHDACDVILTLLEANIAMVFQKVQV